MEPVVGYIRKQLDPALKELRSRDDVFSFIDSRTLGKNTISTVMVVRVSTQDVIEACCVVLFIAMDRMSNCGVVCGCRLDFSPIQRGWKRTSSKTLPP